MADSVWGLLLQASAVPGGEPGAAGRGPRGGEGARLTMQTVPRLRSQPLRQPTFPDPSWMDTIDTLVLCHNCGVDFGEILPCVVHADLLGSCNCVSDSGACLQHNPQHYYAWVSYLDQAKQSKIYLNFARGNPPSARRRYPTKPQLAVGIVAMCLMGLLIYKIL